MKKGLLATVLFSLILVLGACGGHSSESASGEDAGSSGEISCK